MSTRSWMYNDGGRAAAGFQGEAGDCVTRAIAIATKLPYQQVYDELRRRTAVFARGRSRAAKRAARGSGRSGTTPRNGVFKDAYRPWLIELGWAWTPTMAIGQGCKVHLRAAELPSGCLLVCVSHHLVAVIDGVIHDTHDCSRDGTRCVYGYFAEAKK
jgi:hypothetical protein